MSRDPALRFFAFGLPKSGTTWLQMMLDAHPEVSCPSEHQIDYFLRELPGLLNGYNRVLHEIDRRTANQSETPLNDEDLLAITRAVVEACIDSGARRKAVRAAGIKDNSVATSFDLFRQLFPDARYLCIVRDPRDIALSSWHHNTRVEAEFRERASDFADWMQQTWRRWAELYRHVWDVAGGAVAGNGILILRYEDLRGPAGEATLEEAFAHIGIGLDSAGARSLFAATEIDKLREGTATAFYREGRPEAWRAAPEAAVALPPPDAALPLLARFGYAAT